MSFRWPAFVGVVFALMPTTGLFAELHGIPLSSTIFVKWSGALDQSTLADTSIFNEYVAQTYSDNHYGASVQLAFVPRFNCSPIFSVRLNTEAAAKISDDSSVTLTVDNLDVEFAAIIDRSGSLRQYFYDADLEDQQRLRTLLDTSSWVSMSWSAAADATNQDTGSTDPVTVRFSLLGSQMSTQAVEAMCKAHKPIPY